MIRSCIIKQQEIIWKSDTGTVTRRPVTVPTRFICEEDYILIHERRNGAIDHVEVADPEGKVTASFSVPRSVGGEFLVMYVCHLPEYEICVRVTVSDGTEWIDGLYCYDGRWRFLRMTTDLMIKLLNTVAD